MNEDQDKSKLNRGKEGAVGVKCDARLRIKKGKKLARYKSVTL
jgi:hypothetical protein